MSGIRRIVVAHGRWLAIAFLLATVVSALVGYRIAVFAYAAINSAGAVIYVDGLDPRQAHERRRGRYVAFLAALLLPAGLFGVLASKGGTDPIDHSLGDEDIRNSVPGANVYGRGRIDGGSY